MADDSADMHVAALGRKFIGKVASYIKPNTHEASSQAVVMDLADEYDFSHRSRGIAVIITNSKFEATTQRAGAENDTQLFKEAFKHLGFTDIRVAQDLTASEMKWALESIAKDKNVLQNSDCIAIAFSSHGDEQMYIRHDNASVREDTIFGTDVPIRTVELMEIFSDFQCPELIGKPRLVFVQACRGQKLDRGVEVVKDMDVTDSIMDVTVSPAPCFKDFLVIYATPPGHFAFRRPAEGSWFVKCLADIMKLADVEKMSLTKILTRVVSKVALEYQSGHSDPRLNAKKQSPCFYSMLTKDVYFRAKHQHKEEPMIVD
ncbi:caspase-3-like [Gigantopelta aegis]|uniref:caspase-3-like n=1 Tax=Gigantopelta aegis TaxID=1735272 RepID=UPI001B88DD51|nr:caspase-3-like [Gigantopelta aegis]